MQETKSNFGQSQFDDVSQNDRSIASYNDFKRKISMMRDRKRLPTEGSFYIDLYSTTTI